MEECGVQKNICCSSGGTNLIENQKQVASQATQHTTSKDDKIKEMQPSWLAWALHTKDKVDFHSQHTHRSQALLQPPPSRTNCPGINTMQLLIILVE
jgi:hypothetical protein